MIELLFLQMLATGCYVLGRSLQQLNCVNNRWLLIIPTSLFIALTEVTVIVNIIESELTTTLLVLSAGLGGTLGCWCAMSLSNYIKRRKINVN